MLWQYRTGLGLIYINTEPLNKTLVGLYYQRNPVAYEFKKKKLYDCLRVHSIIMWK